MTDTLTTHDQRQTLLQDNSRRVTRNIVLMCVVFALFGLYLLTDVFLFVIGEYIVLSVMAWNLYKVISNGRKLRKLWL